MHTPFLNHLQREMQQFPFTLLSLLDHLQDAHGSTELSPQFQHLLVRRLVILAILDNQTERVDDSSEESGISV